jgi:hypothetical protein
MERMGGQAAVQSEIGKAAASGSKLPRPRTAETFSKASPPCRRSVEWHAYETHPTRRRRPRPRPRVADAAALREASGREDRRRRRSEPSAAGEAPERSSACPRPSTGRTTSSTA